MTWGATDYNLYQWLFANCLNTVLFHTGYYIKQNLLTQNLILKTFVKCSDGDLSSALKKIGYFDFRP